MQRSQKQNAISVLETFGFGNNSYIPFLPLTDDGVFAMPPVLDGSYPIMLPEPLPLGTTQNITTYTAAYVSLSIILYTAMTFIKPKPEVW